MLDVSSSHVVSSSQVFSSLRWFLLHLTLRFWLGNSLINNKCRITNLKMWILGRLIFKRAIISSIIAFISGSFQVSLVLVFDDTPLVISFSNTPSFLPFVLGVFLYTVKLQQIIYISRFAIQS